MTTHSQLNQPYSGKAGPLIARYAILLILLLAFIIRLPLLFMPLTYSLTDTWRQADTASIAHNLYDGGNFNILYPQIDWGGNGPGYVETEFQLYTFITALLYQVFGEHILLGRLVSLVFSLPTLGIFYLLARRLFNQRVATWGLLLFAVAPLSIRYSTAFMPEATVLFFYMLALYYFHRWLDEPTPGQFWLMTISTALAVLVKPTSIHIGLIFVLLLWSRYGLRFLKMGRLWVFAIVALLPSVLYYLHAYNLYLTYGNTFGLLAGGDTKFAGISTLLSPMFYLRIVQLDSLWILAGGGLLPAAIGLILIRRQRSQWLPVYGGITIILYYMLVSRYAQEDWGIQYHIYTLPYLALLVGIGMDWLWGHSPIDGGKVFQRYSRHISAVAVIITLVVAGWIYKAGLFVPDATTIKDCADSVTEIIPPDTLIVVSVPSASQDGGLPNNYQDPRLFFYSHLYGWALPSDLHDPALIKQYHESGAQYLVIYDQFLYQDHPELVAYLNANADQVGPGIEAGCGVYRLHPPGSS